MTRRRRRLAIAVAALGWLPTAAHALDPSVRVVAWNNLGMHCTDADFQVFSLLPPFNTVLAQVTRGGPYDDSMQKNPYPLMRIAVSDATSGAVLAQTDVVLPVSDEMSCSACHASGSQGPARPNAG